ncbi:PilW family protein [Billgrantia sp. Q4P2]|uniref:PilW family protein n=1 Tax=Billgrantia sp. Q4P2 TaxID=3463857 RepID=UPI004056FE61
MPLRDLQGLPLRQSGFTLIELMVALVIGLIIILGAGQLFLMGFQTFRQIELMGNKQAALTFATEALIRDIRRADDIDYDSTSNELTVEFPNNGDMSGCSGTVVRVYRLSQTAVSTTEGWSLNMGQDCESAPSSSAFEPLVTSFVANGFSAAEATDGVWEISFQLMAGRDGETDDFEFRAVNRNQAIN